MYFIHRSVTNQSETSQSETNHSEKKLFLTALAHIFKVLRSDQVLRSETYTDKSGSMHTTTSHMPWVFEQARTKITHFLITHFLGLMMIWDIFQHIWIILNSFFLFLK